MAKKEKPQHDSGYKRLFTHPRMVQDLLRSLMQEAWVEDLDFSRLEDAASSSARSKVPAWCVSVGTQGRHESALSARVPAAPCPDKKGAIAAADEATLQGWFPRVIVAPQAEVLALLLGQTQG